MKEFKREVGGQVSNMQVGRIQGILLMQPLPQRGTILIRQVTQIINTIQEDVPLQGNIQSISSGSTCPMQLNHTPSQP